MISFVPVGHYLNLPVVEGDGRLVAIVDVLKLTYATLEQVSCFWSTFCGRDDINSWRSQMNSIGSENNGADGESGPMWGRFFDSFAGHNDDNESVASGSHIPPDSTQEFAIASPTRRHLNGHSASPVPDLHPNDSASAVNDTPSVLEFVGGAPSTAGGQSVKGPVPVDDGTYVFKFRTPSGRTHRFQARSDNYENIFDIVAGKLTADPFFEAPPAAEGDAPQLQPDPTDFALSYTDSDGDTVLISTDVDVADAVRIARNACSDRVILFLVGGFTWDGAGAGDSEKKAKNITSAVAVAEEEITKAETTSTGLPDGSQAPPPTAALGVSLPPLNDEIFGIPRDMILPASLGFLGVVIIGIFVASRITSREF